MLIKGQENEEARRRQSVRQHQALLSEARLRGLDEAFTPLMSQEPFESANGLTELIDTLPTFGEGEKAVRTEEESPSQQKKSHPEQVIDAVQAFVNPNSWGEKQVYYRART